MSEFLDLEGSDAKDISVFRFRDKEGKLRRYTKITLDKEPIFLRRGAESQFFKLLGLKRRSLEEIDWQRRNSIVQDAYKDRLKEGKIMFRLVTQQKGYSCYAVVTDKFTHIGHREVFELAEQCLAELKWGYEGKGIVRSPSKVWKTWVIKENFQVVGEDWKMGVRVQNSVKGLGSVGAFGYWERLACKNGLTSTYGIFSQARRHIGQRDRLLADIREIISKTALSLNIESLVERALSIPLSDSLFEMLCDRYPKGMQYDLKARYEEEFKGTLYGFVNALTFASRGDTERTIRYQREAYRILSCDSEESLLKWVKRR